METTIRPCEHVRRRDHTTVEILRGFDSRRLHSSLSGLVETCVAGVVRSGEPVRAGNHSLSVGRPPARRAIHHPCTGEAYRGVNGPSTLARRRRCGRLRGGTGRRNRGEAGEEKEAVLSSRRRRSRGGQPRPSSHDLACCYSAGWGGLHPLGTMRNLHARCDLASTLEAVTPPKCSPWQGAPTGRLEASTRMRPTGGD